MQKCTKVLELHRRRDIIPGHCEFGSNQSPTKVCHVPEYWSETGTGVHLCKKLGQYGTDNDSTSVQFQTSSSGEDSCRIWRLSSLHCSTDRTFKNFYLDQNILRSFFFFFIFEGEGLSKKENKTCRMVKYLFYQTSSYPCPTFSVVFIQHKQLPVYP